MYHDTGYTGNADRVQMQISTDAGTTWVDVGTAINRYDGTVGWKQHTVQLTGAGGKADVRIGFHGISAYGNDVHIDDVVVMADVPPILVIPKSQASAACQTTSTIYHLMVLNQSGAADTFNLTASGNIWPATISPVSVTLANMASAPITVTVSVPNFAFDGQADTANIIATSVTVPANTGSASVVTTAGNKWLVGPSGSAVMFAGSDTDGEALFYFDGKNQAGAPVNQLQIFKPASGWQAGAAHPGVATFGGVAGFDEVGGLFYYASGFNAAMTGLTDFARYDPVANTWTSLAAKPVGLGLGAGGATDTGKFVWAGGSPNAGFLSSTPVNVYDIAANTWSTGTTLTGVGFTGGGYAMVGDQLFVAGSYFGTNKFYVYDVSADSWTQLANLPAGQRRAAAGLRRD